MGVGIVVREAISFWGGRARTFRRGCGWFEQRSWLACRRRRRWCARRVGQAAAGSARMRVSASMKSPCQGQRAGRCSVQRRAVRVRRPGSASSRRRRVRAARTVVAGQAEQRGPAQQVVRERGDHRPGGVGVELAGREVRERLVFEVADGRARRRRARGARPRRARARRCGW